MDVAVSLPVATIEVGSRTGSVVLDAALLAGDGLSAAVTDVSAGELAGVDEGWKLRLVGE